jgi:hypothetical protein
MRHPWMKLFCLSLFTCLFSQGSQGKLSQKREVIGFSGSNVDVAFANPDPSTWEPLDLETPSRTDMINRSFRHRGIRDSRGIDVHPVISITAWKFPNDEMTLKGFSKYLLKQAPFKVTNREMKNGRLYLQGTRAYGGYTHVVRRVFSFTNRVGVDVICDSTDSVYKRVKDDFDFWLQSAELTPRIAPAPVQLPDVVPPTPANDEVVVTRNQLVERQAPGGALAGDVAGIKDEDGMIVIWNQSPPYFKVKVEGRDVAGYGSEYLMFTVDGVMLQIQSTALREFCPDESLKDPEAILIAHRDWECRYMQDVLRTKCTLRSWTGRLTDGSPVLYWDVTPDKAPSNGATTRVFCTRYKDGSVITTNSVETADVNLDRAKNIAFYAISHIDFSNDKFDMKKIQEQLQVRKR